MIDETEKTEFKVEVVRIGAITKHTNADTLSLVDVNGYPVVIKTGNFKEGDLAVYVPVDSLVPTDRPEFDFLKKEGRTHHRLRAARFKGIYSMGLLVPVAKEFWPVVLGQDMVAALGVLKYVSPQEKSANAASARRQANISRYRGPKLPVYGLDPLRRYSEVFEPGEHVFVTEKIHGSNARFVFSNRKLHVGSHRVMRGSSPGRLRTLFDRLKLKVMGLLGIKHRAHLLANVGDIWWEAVEKYKLKDRLAKTPNMVLFGEIYGEGVQDMVYDSPVGRKLIAFDVYDLAAGKFLDYTDFVQFMKALNTNEYGVYNPDHESLPFIGIVPVLGFYYWDESLKDTLFTAADTAKSMLMKNHIAEGIVVKPLKERHDNRVGRVAMKYAGQGYHLRKQKEE